MKNPKYKPVNLGVQRSESAALGSSFLCRVFVGRSGGLVLIVRNVCYLLPLKSYGIGIDEVKTPSLPSSLTAGTE